MKLITVSTVLPVVLVVFCITASGEGKITVHSKSFQHGEYIPRMHTCDGKDLSPTLIWQSRVKPKSYALTCTDPDSPGGTFIHWIIYNLKTSVSGLTAAFPRQERYGDALQGTNDFGNPGYNGPCPPPGKAHRYFFTVYALDIELKEPGLSYHEFMRRIKGHILAEGSIMGTYGRYR